METSIGSHFEKKKYNILKTMNPIFMQFASKCAVFQILFDKIHLYFCVPFPLITRKTSAKITSTCRWYAASLYAQSSDIQTVKNNVQDYKTTRRRFNANNVTNDSQRTKRPRVTTHGVL